jgi:D-arginine dehydrogenase
MMNEAFDIAVIGAGMAGMSVAAALASKARVIVLEQEAQPGMHATGRSAALYAPGYGSGAVKALTHASREEFFDPGAVPALVKPRAAMFVATAAQLGSLDALLADHSDTCRRISGAEACRRVPMLRADLIDAAAFDESSADIDVDALLQRYRGRVRAAGGEIACGERVKLARADGGAWRIETPEREIRASVLVNASGAWADTCAMLAGVSPIGIVPKRRTAALVDAPAAPDFADWPAVLDIDERFYFKPDAGKLLVSPADETPVEPHDAYADDEALAEGIDRICRVSTLRVTRAPRSWAGLRSFARDKSPVAGFDVEAAAPFYWLAGQGGYGIQMAPALATYAASEILGSVPPDFVEPWLRVAVQPSRLRS